MSQEKVEIAKRVIDAFNRRDVDAIFECVNPDIEWFPAISVTFGGGLRGREGIESYVREVSDTWEEYRVVVQDLRDLADDRVLVLSRVEDAEQAAVDWSMRRWGRSSIFATAGSRG